MAYSVVSKAELKAAGLSPSRSGRGGYSVVSQAELKKMGSQTVQERQKELRSQAKAAAKAKAQKQAARAAKRAGGSGGAGVSRQPRHPSGTSRGGQWRGKGG